MTNYISDNLLDLISREIYIQIMMYHTLNQSAKTNQELNAAKNAVMINVVTLTQLLEQTNLKNKVMAIINKNKPNDMIIIEHFFSVINKVCQEDLHNEINSGDNFVDVRNILNNFKGLK